jgi:hypothetical protein
MALLVMFFIGCGENNSESPSGDVPGVGDNTGGDDTDNSIVVTDEEVIRLSFNGTSSSTLTTNNQVVEIEVRAFDSDNAPYSEGDIKIIYPNKAITGSTDVGSFNVSEQPLENGVATFIYTGPDSLQDRIEEGDTGSVFGFYHTSDKNTTVQAYSLTYAPIANQVTLTDYELKSAYDSTTMNLNSTEYLSFNVQDKNGNKVEDSAITTFKIELLNPDLATLKDTSGREGASLIFNAKNNVSVSLVSGLKSGIVPIKVTANFKDINNDTRELISTFNMVILSGPPTAMSLSYIGTRNETQRAKFVESWALSVTDKYNNFVNTNPTVSMGMIAGYATSSVANTNPHYYLYYEPNATIEGQIIENGTSDQFVVAGASAFGNVDVNNDVLVTFGKGYSFNASGKWDFTKVNNTTLSLIDNFEGDNTDELAFAVGHNFRDETCRFGKKALGIVYPKDGIYTIDSTGSMTIEVEYDYYLVGKNVVLWANLVGDHNANSEGEKTVRIGHAQQENLRGLGIDPIDYAFAAGQTGVKSFSLRITGTTEYLRNANFGGYAVQISGDGNTYTHNWGMTSMANGVASCLEDGVAYIKVDITTAANTGSIRITDILVGDEF